MQCTWVPASAGKQPFDSSLGVKDSRPRAESQRGREDFTVPSRNWVRTKARRSRSPRRRTAASLHPSCPSCASC